ncbi:MAG: 4-aminobutyrate--2-oxoglutarate transaminase [Elusimicrobia bacterium]|nr:4-aminobutyrate--2-oxoglutarate transaminase [Elusimicrobiota bacterium]MDE2237196.1 4-aminobutyrate--2-oxoglutarate transaminase [Elusimicrobiota bacterium]MDE2425455.1 4-aminobutyrate--2-oxoglutarate transaminase [Elusimicrobiota bacterium]
MLKADTVVSSAAARYSDLVVARAENAALWDLRGRRYIDFAGGIGALNVGHCHPKVVSALRKQAERLHHACFHVCAYPGYLEVCAKLVAALPLGGPAKALLLNSGAEAVENAVKLARFHTKRGAIVSFDYAFHGRTLLCLSLDGKSQPLRRGFGPFAPEIYRSSLPDPYRGGSAEKSLADLERLFLTSVAPQEVAAVIIEPVLGEGGFIVPARGFLKGLRRLCDRHGMLLILDEIQSGFGRTGRFWAMEHEGVRPDLAVVGKSLAAGLPLSAVVGRAEIMDCAPPGSVGGTYGGNPMACAAALAVFEIFREENLLARARRLGRELQARFDRLRRDNPIVGDSRGLGAMRAIELVEDKRSKKPLAAARVKAILRRCRQKGLIVLKAGVHGNVIRALMPLTIGPRDLERGLDILEEALE